ncbi:MAG: DUF4365 domain-containing protein [Sedimentisphaerales bacterium]|nr:DUF4365 domain-containing protein [Sedimentisphaerales bacterium]
MAKRITREQILGEQGIKLIGRRFLDMGFPWHPTNAPLDAGIDGFIELRDPTTGEVSNSWIAVQSKARTRLEKETENSFEFTCTTKDLAYWRRGNMPVLLVVSRPESDDAWWISIKDYFRDPARQNARKIVFDKKANRLAPRAQQDLLGLAQASGAGTYFRPCPKREHLHSNLLPVKRLAARIYTGRALYSTGKELTQVLKEQVQYPPREWFLHGDVVYSVHDLRDEPWVSVCDRATIETDATEDWCETQDPDTRRHFVRLLNSCLRSFCGRIGMRYDKDANVLYFKKTNDLAPRKKTYKSLRHTTSRVVFREYRAKKDPSRIAYYRHVGFEPRFRRFDGQWCLEINPTYRFTSDGDELHPYREEYLSKIKSIEGSGAVGGLVVMFAALLQDDDSLFADNYPHLGFGRLLGVDLPVGIDDLLWRKRDITASASAPDAHDDDGLIDEDDIGPLFRQARE